MEDTVRGLVVEERLRKRLGKNHLPPAGRLDQVEDVGLPVVPDDEGPAVGLELLPACLGEAAGYDDQRVATPGAGTPIRRLVAGIAGAGSPAADGAPSGPEGPVYQVSRFPIRLVGYGAAVYHVDLGGLLEGHHAIAPVPKTGGKGIGFVLVQLTSEDREGDPRSRHAVAASDRG